MTDAPDPKSNEAPSPGAEDGSRGREGDTPNIGGGSDPADRDFGDSAGYGTGGSARDYRDVVGEGSGAMDRPNPLDAVIPDRPNEQDRRARSDARMSAPRDENVRRQSHMRGWRSGEDLSQAVIVVTGASSGIGRATAQAFAAEGASLVLAARRRDALQDVVQECEQLGGRALAVPTDVRDEAQVEKLAQAAVDAFGRIDIWVNDAAVTLFARFEDSPPEVYDEVIRTNLFGYIYGARAALKRFGPQRHGVLINVASMVSYVSQPYTSAYAISKAGIRALTDSLREEYLDQPGIHISMVLPATIDTPLFQHAANYTGRAARAMPPVYPVTAVADTILDLARRPRRQAFVGNAARMLVAQHTLSPNLTQRMLAGMVDRHHLQKRPAAPTSGNVLSPMAGWTGVSGGWQRSNGMGPAGMLAGLVLAAAPLGWWIWSRRRSRDPRARMAELGRSRERLARLQV